MTTSAEIQEMPFHLPPLGVFVCEKLGCVGEGRVKTAVESSEILSRRNQDEFVELEFQVKLQFHKLSYVLSHTSLHYGKRRALPQGRLLCND